MRPSASPAKSVTPISCRSRSSAGSSGSMAMQPLTWKPPMTTVDARGPKLAGQIGGAWKLVGLHAGQEHDAPPASRLNAADDLAYGNHRVRFVVGADDHVDVVAQSAPLPNVSARAYRQANEFEGTNAHCH